MLHEFKKKEIPLDVFTIADKEFLIGKDFVELTSEGYILTEKGIELISKASEPKMVVKYPLTKSGRVGSYNKVLHSMSNSAANALMCAIVNSDFMKKIDVNNTRVFVQSLIDGRNYHKWGEELISKFNAELEQSKAFFDKKKKLKHNV